LYLLLISFNDTTSSNIDTLSLHDALPIFGSTLSSMILLKVTVTEGLTALTVIIALQYLLAFLAKKSETMEKAINSTPTLLFYNGEFLKEAMKKELITEEEIYSEIRQYRIERIEDVRAVVMELNGEMTVVKKSDFLSKHTSLDDIIKE